MSDEFPIIPEKTCLLFFDTLNGGWHPADSAAAAAVAATGIIPRFQKIEQACRAAGIPVFYTQPEHRQDGKDWGLTVVGDPPRVTYFAGANYKGSHNAMIIDEIQPRPGDYIITKHRWSSFHQTHLELSLRSRGIDTIILAGGSTNVGIASTAYAARDRDFSLIILRDACKARDPEVNDFLMNEVFPRVSRVLTVDETIASIAVPATV